ncbi:unnamed protein product [Brassica rapa]|uniref:Uncharacterized protein n=2 Tax=Brassica campestris TaxID=3711 RepID=A0A8D9I290_BRACM|nr:unnamed protein product [Brassica rapa]
MVYPHVEKETEQVIQATKDNNYHQSRKYSPLRGPDHMEKVRSSKNSVARRLRVLASETRGQVEEYVESMLAITNPTGLVTHQITQHNQTPQHQTRDQVMEDLNDVTLQYLSCADPTEAKARQCRVLEGDAQGQMEEVAAGILAANTFAPLAPDTSLGVETVDQRITSPLLSNGFKPSGEPPANQNEDEMEQREVSDSDVPPRRRR